MEPAIIDQNLASAQIARKVRKLRQVAQATSGFAVMRIQPENPNLAFVRMQKADCGLHEGRFARAIEPQQTENFAPFQLETDLGQGLGLEGPPKIPAAITFAHPVEGHD